MSNINNKNLILNNDIHNLHQKISNQIYANNPKTYSETQTIYDFFILSLLKNINITKEKAISLIFNFNKKNFLQIFFDTKKNSKEYTILKNWIKDIKNNINIIKYLIEIWKKDKDMKNICYKIISIGLYTYSIEIITITNYIIEYISKNIDGGIDIDWFFNEGYLIYIYDINEYSLIRVSLVNTLLEIIKNNENVFFKLIKNDYINKNRKEQIISFIEKIFLINKQQNEINIFKKNILNFLQEIYFDYNLSLKQRDIPLIINLLTFGWLNNPNIFIESENYYEEENNNIYNDDSKLKNIILVIFQENIFNKYGINCICSIINLFLLLDKFGKIKNKDGPLIYKTLVYQFINQFDDKFKKELFLENFINFFFTNLKFPIDLFLNPYLEKLVKIQNISLIDFKFFSFIISHPRFTCQNVYDIICILLDYSYKDNLYNKCIITIFNLIFSLDLIIKDNIIYEKSVNKLTSYIINILNSNKITNNNNNTIYDKNLLEIIYCIITKKIDDINNNIKETLINRIEEYRYTYGKNSNELLKLLWVYDIYDDTILNLEEKYYNDKNKKINNNILLNSIDSIDKDNIKNNNCILFPQAKKIFIIDNKDKNNNITRINNRIEINKKMKKKVENDLKKINNTQKNKKIILKQKENLLKTKELNIKERLLKLFLKRSLFSGVSKSKQRPYSYNIEKRKGYLLDEGEGEIFYPYENLLYKRNSSRKKLNALMIFNKYKFCVNYYDEEPREIKGIEALNQKYKNEIKYLFSKIVDNYDNISKSRFIKFLREKNITNDDLTLDELIFCVKNTFPGQNLMYFNENEFKQLLISISYYIMSKKNKMYSLFESYYYFLNLILKNEKPKENLKFKKYSKIKNYLKGHLNTNTGKIDVLLPPGFKIVQKTNVNFIKEFPKNMIKHFNETKIICYLILEEILLKALKYKHGILESFVKIEKKYDLEMESGNIKSWTEDLMIAYSTLPKKYNIIGKEVASILEMGLRQISLGKKLPIIKKEKIEIIENEKVIEQNNIKINKNNNKKEISIIKNKNENINNNNKNKDIIIVYNIEKEKDNNKKEKEKIKDNKLVLKINKVENKKFNNIKVIKFNKVKNGKIKEKNNKKEINIKTNNINIINEKKLKNRIFLSEQNKKITEELKQIKKNRKLKELKKRNLSYNFPIISSNYFIENKEFIQLDKKLLSNLEEIQKNNTKINYYLNKYESHLKLIFDIYHKIGLKTISSINFIIEDSLCYNEYKEFLVNFGILNVLISMEQMNFIFKRLSRDNLTIDNNKNSLNDCKNKIKMGQKSYLNFNNFKMSLLLILILSNMENENIQIMKYNYDNLNEKIVEFLFQYLQLEIPFFKKDIEDMINHRRNMNSKEFKEWKKKKKKDLSNIFNDLYINKDDYSILLKKIKTKFDILPSFSETKITKISPKKKIKRKNNYTNNIYLKKLKIKKNINSINKININTKKNSLSLNKKNKSENLTNKQSNKKKKKSKDKKNIDNEEDMKSIDFSLSYTISTIRDKEIGSIETNINTVTNLINKSEFIKDKKKDNGSSNKNNKK